MRLTTHLLATFVWKGAGLYSGYNAYISEYPKLGSSPFSYTYTVFLC